ncbi:MAG TPA: hypothetical protein VKW78_21875 [Terriglobales bacterium]|nr:hypothetical protein [Terriglobales bacterium]
MDVVKYRLNEKQDVIALVVGERTLEGQKHATLVFMNPSRASQMTSSFWRDGLVRVKDARQGTDVGEWIEEVLISTGPAKVGVPGIPRLAVETIQPSIKEPISVYAEESEPRAERAQKKQRSV